MCLEAHTLRVLENRVRTKIFGPKRDDLYSSPNILVITRRMRWARHVARTGERTDAYRVLAGKYEGKRPLGRRRSEDDIKMDIE
jgi:hypothetical protein